jgi:hypothetical protein
MSRQQAICSWLCNPTTMCRAPAGSARAMMTTTAAPKRVNEAMANEAMASEAIATEAIATAVIGVQKPASVAIVARVIAGTATVAPKPGSAIVILVIVVLATAALVIEVQVAVVLAIVAQDPAALAADSVPHGAALNSAARRKCAEWVSLALRAGCVAAPACPAVPAISMPG